jgi:hypothetical protein
VRRHFVTVFAAAGSGAHDARALLAERVSAALTGATALLALAFLIVLIIRPSKVAQPGNEQQVDEPAAAGEFAALANPAHPAAEVLSEESAAA